jgi:hypothetical protein
MFTVDTFQPKRDIKAIRQGEDGFMLDDGLAMYPRAMLHILPDCPSDVRTTINWAITNGYLKTVAYVQGKELTWQHLTA